jgi:hypothetical protein
MFQSDDTEIDLSGSDEQVCEYLFENIERQVEQATARLVLLSRLVESESRHGSCVEKDELFRESIAISLVSQRTPGTPPHPYARSAAPAKNHVVKTRDGVEQEKYQLTRT